MKLNNARNEVRQKMQQAIKDGNTEGFYAAFEEMVGCIENDLQEEIHQQTRSMQQAADSKVLASRGVRQLTSAERSYFQKLGEAMTAKNPQQALQNLDEVMPETTIDAVFEELRTEHPLLSEIDFLPAGAATKMIYNENGYQEAVWGELCDEIVKELTSGFKVVETGLLKLSAFLPVCKQAIKFGPEWLERYVREILYEAIANGLEVGIVSGDGKEQPIGMIRQVGAGVTVTDGVYPKKEKIAVDRFDLATCGRLVSYMATDPNGKPRKIERLLLLVNPIDYYGKVLPATQIMAPDGSYRSTLPFNIKILESVGVDVGEAVFGLPKRYFADAGSDTAGIIEYSDHYQFLEDRRVYLIKTFANGFAKDNNAFLRLDISGLLPISYRVEVIDERTPSANAKLSALSLGSARLSPTFEAETLQYTATTTNASNVINATPADAGATVAVSVNGTTIPNGSAASWNSGSNTVTVTVTAADGTTTATYTVTVTKS